MNNYKKTTLYKKKNSCKLAVTWTLIAYSILKVP